MSDTSMLSASGNEHLQIAICGGGVGGLALALALRERGFHPEVVERRAADAVREEGLFLTLAPNGINALRALGLADAVVTAGVETTGLAVFNTQGRKLAHIDYGGHRQQFGAPSVTIRRGALGTILLTAAQRAGVTLRLGIEVTGVEETSDSVTLELGGSRESFDILIACDGLRSTVRRLVFPALPQPRYSGLVGTGGVVAVDDVAPTGGLMNMVFGARAFFGYLKAPGQPVHWFNSYPAPTPPAGPIADPRAYRDRVAALHAGDPLDNARILAQVETLAQHYPIYDMDAFDRWSSRRVLLMGDAAHAVAPHSGQGASLAIEDAVVLAACLGADSSPEAAFARFEASRHRRVRTASRMGRLSGSTKLAQGWLQTRIRDLMLPLVMPMGVRAQERLYGFRADLAPLEIPTQ